MLPIETSICFCFSWDLGKYWVGHPLILVHPSEMKVRRRLKVLWAEGRALYKPGLWRRDFFSGFKHLNKVQVNLTKFFCGRSKKDILSRKSGQRTLPMEVPELEYWEQQPRESSFREPCYTGKCQFTPGIVNKSGRGFIPGMAEASSSFSLSKVIELIQ